MKHILAFSSQWKQHYEYMIYLSPNYHMYMIYIIIWKKNIEIHWILLVSQSFLHLLLHPLKYILIIITMNSFASTIYSNWNYVQFVGICEKNTALELCLKLDIWISLDCLTVRSITHIFHVLENISICFISILSNNVTRILSLFSLFSLCSLSLSLSVSPCCRLLGTRAPQQPYV